jgi:hypothetical protein
VLEQDSRPVQAQVLVLELVLVLVEQDLEWNLVLEQVLVQVQLLLE